MSLSLKTIAGALGGDITGRSVTDSPEYAPPAYVLQSRIELIREDLVNTVGGMQAQLAAAVAMADIPSDQGLLHALRLARHSWKAISLHAAELVERDAELASILRQEGAL